MIITLAHMRTEYMKILIQTFDFRFLQAANTLWAVTFCIVLSDIRMIVVLSCWVNFTCWLLQETYLRKSYFIVGAALWEWLFFVLLLLYIPMELLDDVHHYSLVTACGHALSTKDVLANVIGTMTMLSLRNLYRRCQSLNRGPGTTMRALGYRCKIALSPSDKPTLLSGILPPNVNQRNAHPPLEMFLATEAVRFDPREIVWRRVGPLSPLSFWGIAGLYACGGIGGIFAMLSLFCIPRSTGGMEAVAVAGLVTSSLFTGVYVCCCQRQLLTRLVMSFHYWFLSFQIIATGISVMDMFNWRWVPVCGVVSSLLLGHIMLTVDALTPTMKRRLRFRFWMSVACFGMHWIVYILLLLDALILNKLDLQDRVFLNFSVFGRQAQFHVVPFFLSRVVTFFVWSGRYVYVVLTRQNDNALILLRGDVEFDYEGWKKQLGLVSRGGIHFTSG